MQMLASMLLKQSCSQPLFASTIGHYSLWSALLSSVRQRRALEYGFVTQKHECTHGHTNWKYTGSLQNMDASEIWIIHLLFKHPLFSCDCHHLWSCVLCPLNVTSFWGGGCSLVVIVTTCDLCTLPPQCYIILRGVDAVKGILWDSKY